MGTKWRPDKAEEDRAERLTCWMVVREPARE